MSDIRVEHTPSKSNPEALAEAQSKAEEALVGGSDARSVVTIDSSKLVAAEKASRKSFRDMWKSLTRGNAPKPTVESGSTIDPVMAKGLENDLHRDALESIPLQPQEKEE